MQAEFERGPREDDVGRPAGPARVEVGRSDTFLSRGADEPAGLLRALADADSGARALAVAGLQDAVGNARVQRLLSPQEALPEPDRRSSTIGAGTPVTRGSVTYSAGIEATIPRVSGEAPSGRSENGRIGLTLADAPPGSGEHIDLETLLAAAEPELPSVPEPEAEPEAGQSTPEGGTETPSAPVRLPDIEVPAVNALGLTDAVAPTLTKTSSIGRGGATPSGFGITYWTKVTVSGITVTPSTGKFTVTATVDNKVEWQVRSGTGPASQVDIASDTDADITKTNYPTVVSDLTPDMADLGGRPPRTKFWAEDLTIKHEEYHAKEMEGHSLAGTTQAGTWLTTQTAASVAEVNTLLGKIPGRVLAVVYAGMPEVPREERAYGDGAASYTARAEAIKKAGDANKYP